MQAVWFLGLKEWWCEWSERGEWRGFGVGCRCGWRTHHSADLLLWGQDRSETDCVRCAVVSPRGWRSFYRSGFLLSVFPITPSWAPSTLLSTPFHPCSARPQENWQMLVANTLVSLLPPQIKPSQGCLTQTYWVILSKGRAWAWLFINAANDSHH